MTLKIMGKVKSKIIIGLPEKNPTILIQIIFLCDAYFSNYPAGTFDTPYIIKVLMLRRVGTSISC